MNFVKEEPLNIIIPNTKCSPQNCGCSTCSSTASKKTSSTNGSSTSQSKNGFCGTTKS